MLFYKEIIPTCMPILTSMYIQKEEIILFDLFFNQYWSFEQ